MRPPTVHHHRCCPTLPLIKQTHSTSHLNAPVLPSLQVEISLQPWRAFKPDGVILFSDILTPLTGMGIPFDIEAGRGPVIHEPIRTMQVSRCRNPSCMICHGV